MKLKMGAMKNLSLLISFSLLVFSCTPTSPYQHQELSLGEFGAFYTKIHSGEDFENYSRTGDFADIVVDLGREAAKLVFWRGSSYLPYLEATEGRWYVDEIIPRTGNGEGLRPDNINAFSHVKIIRSNPDEVVIHWRYLPEFSGLNPPSAMDPTRFVDEYFYITPDWKVRRTIRQGTSKIDRWKDPENIIIQRFTLALNGIKDVETRGAGQSHLLQSVEASPVIDKTVMDPVAWWKFDEANGDIATESVNGEKVEIPGHKSLWKKGVSGTALHFDGYNTCLELSPGNAPPPAEAISLEAWIAIGAYPWNRTPILQQGDEEGYFLGISSHGNPVFGVMAGEAWEELTADVCLERNRWYHLAGTYDGSNGTMKIFVDGELAVNKTTEKQAITQSKEPLKIGKGMDRSPTDPVNENTFKDSYGFDGLIDEVRIYDRSLSPARVKESYSLYNPGVSARMNPDMEVRSLPAYESPGTFGAHYTRLSFYETWDNLWRFSEHPDVVVTFDRLPTQFVFWRGTGYIPMMVNEKGQWYSNEFNETWGTSGGQGCQEPMSDKESYTNHARILENTDARVVVHWRYPLVDVLHVCANVDENTGWGDWADWYYYIYPDGVAVKTMHLWTHGERNHEWQESMAIFGPNQHPEDIIETGVALTMVDLEGNYVEYSWEGGPPDNVDLPENKVIQHINYKADYDPVTIGEFCGSDVYGGKLNNYAVFPTWNHWPVAQIASDGRYAGFPDRTAHSSLTHVKLPTYEEDFGDRPCQVKILMEAMLNTDPLDVIPLAASWLSPSEVTPIKGCESTGYDRAQRAFLINATEDDLAIRVEASTESPLINPCFIIKDWGQNSPASFIVDGNIRTSGPDARQGIIRDTDGKWVLVAWFKLESTKPVEFAFKNTPGVAGN